MRPVAGGAMLLAAFSLHFRHRATAHYVTILIGAGTKEPDIMDRGDTSVKSLKHGNETDFWSFFGSPT